MDPKAGWLIVGGLLTGCGGSVSPSADPTVEFSFPDPVADTAAATENAGAAKAIDLIRIGGQSSSTTLDLTLEFAEAVTPWSQGDKNGLDGFIYLDIDQNPATGFGDPGHGLGVDFYVDLRDNGSGRVAIVDVAKKHFVTAAAQFAGTSFSVSIPKAAVTLTADSLSAFNLATVIGVRGRKPIVDSAPNQVKSFVVPPPP